MWICGVVAKCIDRTQQRCPQCGPQPGVLFRGPQLALWRGSPSTFHHRCVWCPPSLTLPESAMVGRYEMDIFISVIPGASLAGFSVKRALISHPPHFRFSLSADPQFFFQRVTYNPFLSFLLHLRGGHGSPSSWCFWKAGSLGLCSHPTKSTPFLAYSSVSFDIHMLKVM